MSAKRFTIYGLYLSALLCASICASICSSISTSVFAATADEREEVEQLSSPDDCRPIASASSTAAPKNALPVVCAPLSAREELLTYVNIAEIYRLSQDDENTRFVDRVELKADLADNEFTIGNGASILRLNSFLRVRDARVYLDGVKSRLRLIRASADTDRLFKDLAVAQATTKLNMNVSIQNFLDAPFLGEGGQIIVAAPIPTEDIISASATDPIIKDSNAPALTSSGTTNSGTYSAAYCDNLRQALATRKQTHTEELADLQKAQAYFLASTNKQPGQSLVSALNKSRPVNLAQAVQTSECDLCYDAVHFCKAKGLLPDFIPMKNNCRAVNTASACTKTLPASLKAPVEVCYGGASIRGALTALERWKQRESQLNAKIERLNTVLAASGTAGCTDPEAAH